MSPGHERVEPALRDLDTASLRQQFRLDHDLVLDVIRHKVPELRRTLEAALGP